MPTEKETPTVLEISYLRYPCERDGHGEKNPKAAFLSRPGEEECIAIVFADDEDDETCYNEDEIPETLRENAEQFARCYTQNMPLWCEACGENHLFTLSEVERIVYVQIGERSDLLMRNSEHNQNTMPEFICLNEVFQMSNDIECYSEFVAGCSEGRLAGEKAESDEARDFIAEAKQFPMMKGKN